MKCRHCGADLEKGVSACPACGKKNFQSWQMIVAIVAAAVVVAALGAILFIAAFAETLHIDIHFNLFKKETAPATTAPTSAQNPNTGIPDITDPAPVEPYESEVDFTGDETAVAEKLDAVVTTVNGKTLTNRVLQFYFNMEVSNFVNANRDYLSYLGFDYTRPLNEQKCYDADMSWEAYFVVKAITAWQQYQSVCALAESEGFKLSAEKIAEIAEIEKAMGETAAAAGEESVDAWVKGYFQADITKEDYLEYTELIAICTEYVASKTDKEPTLQEMEAYYNSYPEYFDEYNITMQSGPIVDVRHILIQPEGANGTDTSACTQEGWDASLAKAEELLQQWKDGDATEAQFAELAKKHSTDGGSSANGGLYQDITAETPFVEPFLLWCIDENRKVGDTGIVKTDYGYHIMYFCAGQELWQYYAKQWIVEDREIALLEKAVEDYPGEVVTDAICIREFAFE